MKRGIAHGLWLAAALAGVATAQTVPFETITTLSSEVVPVERDFDVPQSGAGQYRLTLTDLGALLTVPGPAPLDSVHVLVTRGKTVVATLDGVPDGEQAPSPVDTLTFDATPGTYTVHVVGKPGEEAGSGPIGVKIENVATSTEVLALGATLAPPGTVEEDLSTYQTEIDIPADGSYELVLADLAFPRSLATAGVFVFKAGASSITACLSLPVVPNVCPASSTVNLQAGKYQVVAAGGLPEDGSSDAGVYSVHFRAAGGGAVVHSRTVEIGRVQRISPASFQLDAGAHRLRLTDLAFPAQLSAASVIVTRAAQIAAIANNTTTTEAPFTVASDATAYDVFAYVSPDATAKAGSYEIDVLPASGPAALSAIKAIGDSSGSPAAYTFAGDVTAAGAYRARLGDFQFPVALSSTRLAIVQNGAVVASTDASNPGPTLSLDLANLATGRVTAIVIARPAVSGTVQQSGTFGLELASTSGNQTAIDATQGVGALISVRKVTFAQAGKYDLTLTDLDFPEAFRDLMAVISKGATKLGQVIVGSGGSNPSGGSASIQDFDASAGDYSVTIIAQPTATENAATYAITFAQAPAAPTVTLSADPQSVTAGNTTRLTWSTQNATSCIASSNPAGIWSGSKATSGNESSAAITAATTFTLRCTGAGGRSSEQSVNVTVTAQSGGGGGGGGSFGWLGLLGLAACRALGHARQLRAGASDSARLR